MIHARSLTGTEDHAILSVFGLARAGTMTGHTKLPVGRILTGDCVAILKTLPASSVDLIFADPPYNLQLGGERWHGTRQS